MRKNRIIIKKEHITKNPIIYIRIKNNQVMYIGESKDILLNRPCIYFMKKRSIS